MSLRSHLEAHAVVTPADLRGACARAEIYGGGLDTALLELGLLAPSELDAALSAARGLPSAPAELLRAQPRPWDRLDPRWYERRLVAPLAVRDDRLWVAIHPELSDDDLSALCSEQAALEVTVTAECCLRQLLSERAPAPARYLALADRYLRALTLTTDPDPPALVAEPEAQAEPPRDPAAAPVELRTFIPARLLHAVPFPEPAAEPEPAQIPALRAQRPPSAASPAASSPPAEPQSFIPALTRPASPAMLSETAIEAPPTREAEAPRQPSERPQSAGYVPTTLVHREAPPSAPAEDPALEALLQAALAGSARPERLAAELRARGRAALHRLVQRFPGPIELAREELRHVASPSAQGPLLRLCVAIGEELVPLILSRVDDPDAHVRFYCALIFQELRSPSAAPALAELAFDADPGVRTIAMRVLETYSRASTYMRALKRIRGELSGDDHRRRALAFQALGTVRDVKSIPRMVEALAEHDPDLRTAALTALCSITGQHFGLNIERWRAWYASRCDRTRVDWMLESLAHSEVAVRRWAADELMRITGQRLPFPASGAPTERAEAIERWQAWWSAHQGRLLS
jgi:HEAT repeat protein